MPTRADRNGTLSRLSAGVAVVIVAVWVVTVIADVLVPRYEIPLSVNAAIGLVATYLFASREVAKMVERKRNGGRG